MRNKSQRPPKSKTPRKMAQVKERGGAWEERKVSFLPIPLFHCLVLVLFPRSFFAPKPNGNACYPGYVSPIVVNLPNIKNLVLTQ